MKARAAIILQRINELGAISEEPGCLTRTFGGPACEAASRLVMQWMQEAGLQVRIDAIGNVRGRRSSNNPDAKTLVIGSHIDTVCNAGKFDGPLGVIMGIDLVAHLTNCPFNIELIAFCDEEGVRFQTTYLGSRVVAGTFDSALLSKTDAHGISLKQAIGSNAEVLSREAIPATEWLGYFEIHIEQGPVLFEKNIPVALVTAIAGQQRIAITFKGEAGHAGTVPMPMRHDALCAAAEFILAVEDYAKTHNITATVGELHIHHAASNVIPGTVHCTLDVRNTSEHHFGQLAKDICHRRQVELDWQLVQHTVPVQCDAAMSNMLAKAITASGHPLVKLVSGAGHDAVAISAVAPVSMLFVRCYKGISHQPQENVEEKDIAATVEVCTNFITHLIHSYNPE